MGDPITINFDSLQRAVKQLNLPEETINEILQLTAAKTARWAYSRLNSKLGKALKIDLRVRRSRILLNIQRGSDGAQVWFGLDGISLSKFNPVQTATGVHSDVMDVPGAFMGKGQGTSRWAGRGVLGASVFKRRGTARLPIDKQFYDLRNVGASLFDQVTAEVIQQLAKNFEHAYLQTLNK